ncbi:MAG: MarR family transcriptional regulator [Methanomassiliicoccaceae archaeon]|nr:MarR family transcriptional regulator [Methanomassiliicoccaceae archaeon]
MSRQKRVQEGIGSEAFILHCINENQGRTVPSQISDEMGISSARVATALNSLEDKGLITREIDVGDRRKIIVKLTPKGRDHVEEWHKKLLEKLTNVLMQIGEEDAKELVRITGKLTEVLSKPRP